MPRTADRGQILLYASRGRNAEVLVEALRPARATCLASRDVDEFRDLLRRMGHELGAVVVTERALAESARDAIHAFQDRERVWSELPIILLSPRRRGPERLRPLRNVILLHQPTAPRQFRSVVQLALETRGHQFEVQDLLLQLEEQRDWLEQALLRERHDRSSGGGRRDRERALTSTRRRLLRRGLPGSRARRRVGEIPASRARQARARDLHRRDDRRRLARLFGGARVSGARLPTRRARPGGPAAGRSPAPGRAAAMSRGRPSSEAISARRSLTTAPLRHAGNVRLRDDSISC